MTKSNLRRRKKEKRFSLCDDSQQLIPASYVVGHPPFTKMTSNQNILPRICRYIHRILHGKGKKGSNFLQYPAKGQFVSNCSRSQVCTYRVLNFGLVVLQWFWLRHQLKGYNAGVSKSTQSKVLFQQQKWWCRASLIFLEYWTWT